jgi:hypothetical protein
VSIALVFSRSFIYLLRDEARVAADVLFKQASVSAGFNAAKSLTSKSFSLGTRTVGYNAK